MILGGTAFGRAVLVELARRWRVRDPQGDRLVPLALVDEAATEIAAELSQRYPFLSRVCRITPLDGGLTEALRQLPRSGFPLPPDRVFICYDDEERALKTALTAEQLWHGGPGSVVVRLDRLANLREAFGSGTDDGILDDLSGALRLYGVVHAACDPALIGDDLVERLARVIHECYVLARWRRGDAPGSSPSLVPWERLPESLRRANREQARDIGAETARTRMRPLPASRSRRGARAGGAGDRTAGDHGTPAVAGRAVGGRLALRPRPGRRPPAAPGDAELGTSARGYARAQPRGRPRTAGHLADAGFRIVRVGRA